MTWLKQQIVLTPNPSVQMNLVDDTKKKVEDQKHHIEEIGQKEIELAEEQQKLQEEMAQVVKEDKPRPDEDASLG